MKLNFLIVFFLLAFAACKSKQKNTYAIRDFRDSLQPYLVKLVNSGFLGNESSWILQKKLTDADLNKLIRAEQPILRASAFREMMNRKSFDHFTILITHLDDTALISRNSGERGLEYKFVADDMIDNMVWKDSISRQKTIDSVIISHNYLRSAYSYRTLSNIEPEEKYYASIKQMAERENQPFHDIEFALYALAKFKKPDDISFIKNMLSGNLWRVSSTSFNLMKDYQNEAYLDVFKKYSKVRFYLSILETPGNSYNATPFFEALASYKNYGSAILLDSLLNKKPFIPQELAKWYKLDSNSLKNQLAYTIWENPCDAYINLRKQVEKRVKEDEKNRFPYTVQIDKSDMPIIW